MARKTTKKGTTRKAKPAGGPFLAMAVFCDSVLEDKDGVLSAIRIIDTCNVMIAPNAPANIPSAEFPATIRQNALITLRTGGSGTKHRLTFVVEDPEGERSEAYDTQVKLGAEPHAGLNVKTSATFTVKRSGLFWLDVIVDGHVLTRMPLNIQIKKLRTD